MLESWLVKPAIQQRYSEAFELKEFGENTLIQLTWARKFYSCGNAGANQGTGNGSKYMRMLTQYLHHLCRFLCKPVRASIASSLDFIEGSFRMAYQFILFPEDVSRWIRTVDETREVEAGRVVHVQLPLADNLGAGLWNKREREKQTLVSADNDI